MDKYTNDEGKYIGSMRGGVYRKRVSKAKHFMKIYDAWGIDEKVIQDISKSCTDIRIMDLDTRQIWSTPFTVFTDHCMTKEHGHGRQCFLSRKYWTITEGEKQIQERVISQKEIELKTLKLI